MLQRLRNFFHKNESPIPLEAFLKALNVGDWVEMEYCDPKTVGIISANTLSNTRLNADELENRVIRGCIERVQYETAANSYSIKIKTFKVKDGYLSVREFMLMSFEVTNYRILA